jgi:hypothetical protein
MWTILNYTSYVTVPFQLNVDLSSSSSTPSKCPNLYCTEVIEDNQRDNSNYISNTGYLLRIFT